MESEESIHMCGMAGSDPKLDLAAERITVDLSFRVDSV